MGILGRYSQRILTGLLLFINLTLTFGVYNPND
jgi:hypothetical protein